MEWQFRSPIRTIQQSSYYPKYLKMVAENSKKTPQESESMQPVIKRATPKNPTTSTPVKQTKPAPHPTKKPSKCVIKLLLDSTTGPSSSPDDDYIRKVIHESSSTSIQNEPKVKQNAAPKDDKDQGEVDCLPNSGVSIPVS
ncbi:hypothetical protein Tco_1135109 [Tanacetum coccineum]